MDYRSPDAPTLERLRQAIRRNAIDAGVLLMGRDTSFAGTADDLPSDEEAVTAIKSVPTHY